MSNRAAPGELTLEDVREDEKSMRKSSRKDKQQ